MMFNAGISLTGYHSQIIVKDHFGYYRSPATAIAQKVKAIAVNTFGIISDTVQGISNTITWTCKLFQKPPLPYVILALDGGGVRGKVSLAALKQIESEIGDKVINAVDCIAGVSTGGIIAAALSVPSTDNPKIPRYSAKDVDKLYDDFATKVFSNSNMQNILTLWGSMRAKYYSPREILESIIGKDMPLKNTLAKKLIITSVDLLSSNLIFFENHIDGNKPRDLDHENMQSCPIDDGATILDALEATSAAPTYFPTKAFKDYNLADGGISENNPAEIATLLALKDVAKDRPILVISIGTGKMPGESITTKESLNWGWVQWVEPLIDYLFHTKAQQANQQMELMARSNPLINYVRFQTTLEDASEFALDNASPENLQKLEELGTRTFKHFIDNGGREKIIVPLKEKLKALHIKI